MAWSNRRLRALRIERKLSRNALAKLANCSPDRIEELEMDRLTEPRASMILKLAAALKVPCSILLGEHEVSM